MKNNVIKAVIALIVFFPQFSVYASGPDVSDLIEAALRMNPDVRAADAERESERLGYESVSASQLPSINLTGGGVGNSMYSWSDGREFSMDSFSYSRVSRHSAGAGLGISSSLPTGGTVSLSGNGSLGIALSRDTDGEPDPDGWSYLLSPSASLYISQPLFIDRLEGSPLDFDNASRSLELAGLSLLQAELAGTSAENSLILSVVQAVLRYNSLLDSRDLLQRRLALAEKNFELVVADERTGRISRIERIAEELAVKRQQESLMETGFLISSAARELESLTGLRLPDNERLPVPEGLLEGEDAAGYDRNVSVLLAEAAKRGLELRASALRDGSEPTFELSGSLKRSDTDTAETFEQALADAAEAEYDLSFSLGLSVPLVDWGKRQKKTESELKAIEAAEHRIEAARAAAGLRLAAADERLKLIEEKIALLENSLAYDDSLIERENLRLEAGLTSEVAVETIVLDRRQREYSKRQLEEERLAARLELYGIAGYKLGKLF